jgi:hypothetical protein
MIGLDGGGFDRACGCTHWRSATSAVPARWGPAARAGKQRVGSVPSSRCRCVVGLKVGIGRVKTENAVGHNGTRSSDIALACASV